MDCVFSRRRFGNTITDLKSLFKAATITNIDGNGSSSRKTIKISNSAMPSGVLCGLGFLYNYGATSCLQKISNKIVGNIITRIPSTSQTCLVNNGTTQIELSQTGSTGAQYYAATLALFSFSATAEIIDSVLSGCTLTHLAVPNGTGGQTLSTTSTTHSIVIVCHKSDLTVWEYSGGWKKIISTPTSAGTANGTTLSLTLTQGEYGSGCIIALD